MAQRFSFSKEALSKIVYQRAKANLVKKAKEVIQYRVERAKSTALEVLNKHPITQDLENLGQNNQGLISGGEGNLRQLLGFRDQFSPVAQIEEMIRNGIQIKERSSFGDEVQLNVIFPSFEILEQNTKGDLEWVDNMSWLQVVDEKGSAVLPNVAFYIYLKYPIPSSRSGGGIQGQKENKQITLSKASYYNDILKAFRDNL